MGMSVSGGGGRRGGGRRGRRAMSDINVTPMVDVMLVLLVIFMVTAPLLTTGINVDLPQAASKQIREPDNKAVTVTVDAKGKVFIQETPVEIGSLVARMQAITQANPEALIYVRGDTSSQYGVVLQVLGALKEAGFQKAALVTSPVTTRGKN